MMGWPQWCVLAIHLISTASSVGTFASQRKPREAVGVLIGAGLMLWLLWMGGFWR